MESMAFHGDTIDIRTASNFEFHSRNLISGPYEISRAFEAVSERGSDLNKNLMVQAAGNAGSTFRTWGRSQSASESTRGFPPVPV